MTEIPYVCELVRVDVPGMGVFALFDIHNTKCTRHATHIILCLNGHAVLGLSRTSILDANRITCGGECV